MQIEPTRLQGRFVRLEPFNKKLQPLVREALNVEPKDWSIMATSAYGDHFDAWWETALKQAKSGKRVPFAIRRLKDEAVVGTTSYLDIRPQHRGVEIGATFLRPEARTGEINGDAKFVLLDNAFKAGAVRAEFMIDMRNAMSMKAVEKLGAKREGVLRRHKTTWTGYVRDTAVYSILDKEWPAVEARLKRRLAAYAL